MNLRLAYSPDADDAFMFRAAIEQRIDTEGLTFEPVTLDTQSLNDAAIRGDVDVSAISVAAYPYLDQTFVLLDHGGSVGMGYGPVIVSRDPHSLDELDRMHIATPGERTTAHMVARLIAPNARFTTVPITPYGAAFDIIQSGDVDAGIIIHEGRLTYEQHGLVKIVDIGEWWLRECGMPLPLGANVIRRALGAETIATASRVLKRSIRWALDHRVEMIDYLIGHVHRPSEVATHELLDEYLGMYANDETYEYSQQSRLAIQRLMDLGAERGLLPHRAIAEFV